MRGYSRKITYMGMTLTIRQWIDKLDLKTKEDTIYQRMFRLGWPIDKVFISKPEKPLDKKAINNGVEAWQEIMLFRGYFRKENRIKVYKQLNTWYKEFRAQDMRAA